MTQVLPPAPVTAGTARPWRLEHDPKVQAAIDEAMATNSSGRIAVMLYGSTARGSSNRESDIDVLELVEQSPCQRSVNRVNVSQYMPKHIRSMARSGSLFVLHLKLEGKILYDPTGTLRSCLDSYQTPVDYESTWRTIRVAAGALDAQASDVARYRHGLGRLGIYLLRTAVYLRCIGLGVPNFDVVEAAALVGDGKLKDVLNLRRNQEFEPHDIHAIKLELEKLVPNCWFNRYESVASYAIATANHREVGALLAAVMSDAATVEYTSLTVPAF